MSKIVNGFLVRDEDRHKAALAYLRQKTRDASPPDKEDDAVHIHIHGAGAGQDLPSSVQSDLPPKGRSSGNPVKVADDPSMQTGGKSILPSSKSGPKAPLRSNFGGDQDPDEFEEEEPDEEEGQVLGELPEPPEGYTYALQPQEDGSVAVVCVPDTGEEELQTVNTGDRARGRSFSDAKTRSVLAAMNKANRAHWRTGDGVDASAKENVIFMHTPAEGERLVLREKPALRRPVGSRLNQ